MIRLWHTKRTGLSHHGGFTLIELMIVVAIIGTLAAIAIPLYANLQTRVRIARAQADARSLSSAISIYATHMGTMPAALTDLTSPVVNDLGTSAGPFLASVPNPPTGGSPPWSAYAYTSSAVGTYSITATGDGTTIAMP
jgi:prepilin-type N-terminal cleavage/methylation domain-containing protein